MTSPILEGAESIRLWLGDTNSSASIIPLAILHRHTAEVGVVGLLRKNSVSAFRSPENIELLIDGPSDELGELASFGLDLSGGDSKATKFLCDGKLPFIGLAEKIERELAWKAERSDVLAKPNPYKELERVFSAMSLKCYPIEVGSIMVGNDFKTHGLLLTSSKDEVVVRSSPDTVPSVHQYKGNGQWETLELYLEKYKKFHARLPIIVAETLLCMDLQIELPLWLVHMFKDGQRERSWGMTGQESSPSSLFRLYVEYGRYTEATNLLLECIDSFASMRPADIINRKRPFSVWFPYTAIGRLWCQLEESIKSGYMVDQCDKLKKLLHGALLNHLKLLKLDLDDAISSASG
ncbi:hypothetical protein Q3G72_016282 [Acer saccharum]|nr:hypothetical protein Q3G72_016282 [Acer saccharum]